MVEEHLVSNSSKVRYEKNVCFCRPSFYGDRCEFHYVKCLSSMLICENNGTCIDSDDPNEPFRCSCTEEFRGRLLINWLDLQILRKIKEFKPINSFLQVNTVK